MASGTKAWIAAGLGGLLGASALALSAAPTSAAHVYSSRDCKYYGVCGPESGQFMGRSDGMMAPTATTGTQAPAAGTMHDETGINGPHGPGW